MIERTRLLPRSSYVRDARLFVIAVEGEREEPWYFRKLEDEGLVPARRVRLVLLPPADGESAPEHVAARLADYEAANTLIPQDARWLVVDVDRHHNLAETLARADAAGWSFAVSNPCFEVWLQLHYVDAAKGATSRSAKKEWGVLRSDRGERRFGREDVDAACSRAAAHPGARAWVPEPPPATTVFRLVRDLLGA